jgi:(p)ppGpp synthase/HD superfamily hydrolase
MAVIDSSIIKFEPCIYSVHLIDSLISLNQIITNKFDIIKIKKSIAFAKQYHDGQLRRSGEPYYSHLIEVANITLQNSNSTDIIIAALLHDILEDTECTLTRIDFLFGKDVANLVSGLSKTGDFVDSFKADSQTINLKKIDNFSKDLYLIKLADRLHNMRTIHYLRPDKQTRIAAETVDLYIPIGTILGYIEITQELRDRSLKILYPPR